MGAGPIYLGKCRENGDRPHLLYAQVRIGDLQRKLLKDHEKKAIDLAYASLLCSIEKREASLR